MGSTPYWFLILQAIASFAIVLTFFVYWRQLVAMRGQLDAARQASTSQNALTLIQFLQAEDIRIARRILINLQSKPLDAWSDAEKSAAEQVCTSYDIVAIMIKEGIAPKSIFVENWGDSITKCYSAAAPFIAKTREIRGAKYWDDFEWLAGVAVRS